MYALYSTDVWLKSRQIPDLYKLMPMRFQTKNAALVAARTLIEAGAIVWQVKGPNDDVMERAEIELRCRHRASQ